MSEVKLDTVEVVSPRRRRSAQEGLRIVEEAYLHGMSVPRVVRKYGSNVTQVFQWRRLQQDGLLRPSAQNSKDAGAHPCTVMLRSLLKGPFHLPT
ncbi:transposase [Granulicella arctica]|uniref:transposase n=1 Tax=Granulicella arctica TaxID=940613 RepID=UPI0021DFBAE5|nr:transposase [Granulicella arctica]